VSTREKPLSSFDKWLSQKKEIEDMKLKALSQNTVSKSELDEVKENQAKLSVQLNSIQDTLVKFITKLDKE
jgi:hypothetical protein